MSSTADLIRAIAVAVTISIRRGVVLETEDDLEAVDAQGS